MDAKTRGEWRAVASDTAAYGRVLIPNAVLLDLLADSERAERYRVLLQHTKIYMPQCDCSGEAYKWCLTCRVTLAASNREDLLNEEPPHAER